MHLSLESDSTRINAMDHETKQLAGRYQLHEQVGLGGMAQIYRARDLNLQRDVAIKVLREDWMGSEEFRASFLHEARAAANLAHPNIVTIFDFGHDADRTFIVMEYIQGTDLKSLIRRQGRLAVIDAVQMMTKICQGVGYAHRAGLVHCDLKPQNILITNDGSAKITDFGIARALASIHPDEHSDIVWGSPLYFAPEQARGEAPSPASDVYALGVIFYEMLTGETPFKAGDAASLAELHIEQQPPSPRLINPAIPEELDQIILKVLSKEPTARYRTADQFGRILITLQESHQDLSTAIEQLEPVRLDEPHQSATINMDRTHAAQFDWLAVALGLAAFLALGGLLPLWLWVCLLYPSCPINVG
jgi:serine/threonine-protein kinase